MTDLWCERAVVDGRPRSGVSIRIVDGRFASIECDAAAQGARQLPGLTLPGLANAHSHAFHRALRSRTQADRGTFWTWRELMYRAAERLDPENCHRLARAVFAEMALAGVVCVGEFHYVHHQPDGTPYDDPNEMGSAILAAAAEAGIRITLLDTLYLRGGISAAGYAAPQGAQRRFADPSADQWAERVDRLAPTDGQQVGAAIHSVRAASPEEISTVAQWSAARSAPVHAHVSEQVGENDASVALHGATPTAVLAAAGALSDTFTAVHATHLTSADIAMLADAGATVAMCPTTERDLGDGIGPTTELSEAGISLALGSDSHAVIDLFEEARCLELHERLRRLERGIHSAGELLEMATVTGHRSLGWPDAGTIAVGNRADLVTVDLASVRTAGISDDLAVEAAIHAATAADVHTVHVDGRCVVDGRHHLDVDAAGELDITIRELMDTGSGGS